MRLVSLGHLVSLGVTWSLGHLVRKAKVPFGSPDHFLGWLEENARNKSNKTCIFFILFLLGIFVKNYDTLMMELGVDLFLILIQEKTNANADQLVMI